jgi:glucokinase
MLLVADIGATKTDVAVLASDSDARSFVARQRFHSADFPSLAAIAREFVAQTEEPVTHACFDVAGPVVDGRAHLTNLPWDVSARALQQALHLDDVWVINDLTALAYAIPLLQPGDLHALHRGEPAENGAMAVIAPGTGLGEAFLVWDGVAYRAYPSEGGHADFAPTTSSQVELLRYLQRRFEHVSYELVCSGRAIPHLYEFCRDIQRTAESPRLAAQLAVTEDRAPLIVEHALRAVAPDPLCLAALETFVSILGAEAGNLALKVLATGGLFIGGGIPGRILPILEEGSFIAALRRKGRFAELLSRIPVHVITVEGAALIGAASYGLTQVKRSAKPSADKERFRD